MTALVCRERYLGQGGLLAHEDEEDEEAAGEVEAAEETEHQLSVGEAVLGAGVDIVNIIWNISPLPGRGWWSGRRGQGSGDCRTPTAAPSP